MRISVYILILLAVFLSCKTGQNHNFIKLKREKQVILAGAPTPHLLFVLESRDTLKFSSRDIYSLLDERARKQIKNQGYLSDQSLKDLSEVLRSQGRDTIIFQKLSAVDGKTLRGILDIWIARELLLKGKAVVALNGQPDNPIRLKYIYIKDYLGGQQGTFYTEGGKKIYVAIISLGE